MVIDKIFVTNTTNLTLSERFTILQHVRPTLPAQRTRSGQNPPNLNAANLRNRRLLDRLGMTPVVQAAMALQKRPLKQRIGKIGRYTTPPRRGNMRSINQNGNTPPSKRNRQFSQQTYAYTQLRKPWPVRRRSRSITNSEGNRSPSNSFGEVSPKGGQRNGNYYRRGRGSRGRGIVRSQSGGNAGRGAGGTFAGRGRGRGRGRGARGGMYRDSNQKQPTKEELDEQLDQYMSGSRSQLDKELDSYMNDSGMDME